jgi:hypothetical protein
MTPKLLLLQSWKAMDFIRRSFTVLGTIFFRGSRTWRSGAQGRTRRRHGAGAGDTRAGSGGEYFRDTCTCQRSCPAGRHACGVWP